MLSKEEKNQVIDQHLKNLELNSYNVTLSLVIENSTTEPNEDTIKLLEEQLSDLNAKIDAVNQEKVKLNSN